MPRPTIFINWGFQKLMGYEGPAGSMSSLGVPGVLPPLVILLELDGGIAILLGLMARWLALGLAAFARRAAVPFHLNLADRPQSIVAMKNLAIAGGLLMLYLAGPGGYAIRQDRSGADH